MSYIAQCGTCQFTTTHILREVVFLARDQRLFNDKTERGKTFAIYGYILLTIHALQIALTRLQRVKPRIYPRPTET
jgi:hypothetical protein